MRDRTDQKYRNVYEELCELKEANPDLDYDRLIALVGANGENIEHGFIPDFAKIFAVRDSSGNFTEVEISISIISPPVDSGNRQVPKLIVSKNEFIGSHLDELPGKKIAFGSLVFECPVNKICSFDDGRSSDAWVSLDGQNYWGLGLFASLKRLRMMLDSEKNQVFEWHIPLNSAYPIKETDKGGQ